MAAGPSGITERIEAEVRAGVPREEIVARLVAGGLSPASAERFVDRALAGGGRALETHSAAPDDDDDDGGRWSLIGGAFWLSLGLGITVLTYALAKPGGTYVIAWGAAISGVIAFARGLNRFLNSRRMPFPWMGVAVAALVPVLAISGIFGFVKAKEARTLAAARAAAAARDRESRAAKDRADAQAAAAAARAASETTGRDPASIIARSLAAIRDPRAPSCEAALQLGRLGAREAIPDLLARLADAPSTSVKGCAAYALVDLGETEGAFAFYAAAAASADFNLRQVGLQGFGHLGERAVPDAFPHLEAALRSSDSTERLLAVEALRWMGPQAVPYLRTAASDGDDHVRQRAHKALYDLGAR
jgi:hypothetical protein